MFHVDSLYVSYRKKTLTFYFNILKRTNMLLYEYADLELKKYLFIIVVGRYRR